MACIGRVQHIDDFGSEAVQTMLSHVGARETLHFACASKRCLNHVSADSRHVHVAHLRLSATCGNNELLVDKVSKSLSLAHLHSARGGLELGMVLRRLLLQAVPMCSDLRSLSVLELLTTRVDADLEQLLTTVLKRAPNLQILRLLSEISSGVRSSLFFDGVMECPKSEPGDIMSAVQHWAGKGGQPNLVIFPFSYWHFGAADIRAILEAFPRLKQLEWSACLMPATASECMQVFSRSDGVKSTSSEALGAHLARVEIVSDTPSCGHVGRNVGYMVFKRLTACTELILRDANGVDLLSLSDAMLECGAADQLRVMRLPNLVLLDGCVKSVRRLLDVFASLTCLDLSLDEGCINFISPSELSGILNSGSGLQELCMQGWCVKLDVRRASFTRLQNGPPSVFHSLLTDLPGGMRYRGDQ